MLVVYFVFNIQLEENFLTLPPSGHCFLLAPSPCTHPLFWAMEYMRATEGTEPGSLGTVRCAW